ncbi:SRPBCC family protein [Chloroflexota bacterium]
MEMNGTTVINRPVETVFAYLNNVSNDVYWRTGVTESGLRSGESLESGVIGYTCAGNIEAEWRVVAYTADESVDWDLISGPYRGCGGYRLVPVDDGTQFTLVADVEPTGLYKLLGPLFGWIGRRQNQADVEKLRDILEST